MNEAGEVTVADTVRWLHEEGLIRLAGVGARMSDPIAAYAVDVATGTVVVHPVAGVGLGSDVLTLAADDLPFPTGTSKRLVIVGVTTADAVLVVDLAASTDIAINADAPEEAARSWAMQLLMNPDITLTTNSADIAIGPNTRCGHRFLPGTDTVVINVDDRRPPITTVTLNATTDGPDHLDVYPDGSGELYLGARFWELRRVMCIDDVAWSSLTETLLQPDSAGDSEPAQEHRLAPVPEPEFPVRLQEGGR
ncbi:hypothetical protein [Nocardia iowensis]|uniref:Uncharacterized protein n=1 Tax=Nocardia iowensis TaxID=204891 RepID=A0ABX8RZS6_NOCIO|nr:hypothetical protein [Nocardia iowensis]QXN94656.1 hypothetical protein KV110_17340 [Nocardia iowensis]